VTTRAQTVTCASRERCAPALPRNNVAAGGGQRAQASHRWPGCSGAKCRPMPDSEKIHLPEPAPVGCLQAQNATPDPSPTPKQSAKGCGHSSAEQPTRRRHGGVERLHGDAGRIPEPVVRAQCRDETARRMLARNDSQERQRRPPATRKRNRGPGKTYEGRRKAFQSAIRVTVSVEPKILRTPTKPSAISGKRDGGVERERRIDSLAPRRRDEGGECRTFARP